MYTIDTLGDADVPLLGDVDSIVSAVRLSGADTVAVVSSGRIGPEKLRWISWQLEGSATELVVSLDGTCSASTPDVDVQPATHRDPSMKMTTPGNRIWTCTQNTTDRRQTDAAGQTGFDY